MTTLQDINHLLSNIHTQQLDDLFGACRMYLEEPANTLWEEMARASIGEVKLGSRSSFEDRYHSGKAEILNEWMDSAFSEIQKRVYKI